MKIAKITIGVLVALAALYLLAFNYYDNRWRTVKENVWYTDWQEDSENLVLEKIEDARENGVWNNYGMMPSYLSQSGAQGIAYSYIDAFLGYRDNITNYLYIGNSAMLAILVLILCWWFWREFNLLAGIAVYLCMFYSQWMVVSGRNLYWVMWTFFLPMVSVLLLCKSGERTDKKWFPWVLAATVFATCLLRFCCGFEYATTVLVAMEAPLVYYACRYKWGRKKYLKLALFAAAGGLLAFAAGLIIVVWQLSMRFGSWAAGWEEYKFLITRRTGAFDIDLPQGYENALNVPFQSMVNVYMDGDVYPPLLGKLHMSFFARMYFLVCLVCFFDKAFLPGMARHRRSLLAINLAVLISFAGPLSWFWLARGHSAIHLHITFILWSIPILPFIFGATGALVGYILLDVKDKMWAKLVFLREAWKGKGIHE